MRRVKVSWQTQEVRQYEATFEVPEDVEQAAKTDSDAVQDYFFDGNCDELVSYDGDTNIDSNLGLEFYREVQLVEELADGN